MTVEEYRASQKRRIFAVSHSYGVAGLVLGALLAIQEFFGMLENSIKYMGLGRRRRDPMTLMEFRGSHKRRFFAVTRSVSLVGLGLVTLMAISAGMAGQQAGAKESQAKPAMQQQMQAQMQSQMQSQMQDMMVMMQNTAVWTPRGLVVLQGNRLLHYTPEMKLEHTIALPVPPSPAMVPATMPRSGNMPGAMPMAMPPMRSRVAARILPTADGLVVIRGQQVLWLDSSFKVAGQATLPDLPPLTPAEMAAVCPMNPPMMPGGGMMMGSASMPGMPGMPIQGAAPVKAELPMPRR